MVQKLKSQLEKLHNLFGTNDEYIENMNKGENDE